MAIPEYAPGKSRRIQLVGSGDRHSTVWGIFSARHTADLYVCPRMHGGAIKVSLHQSGSWQVGLTAEHAARQNHVSSRHWDIWNRSEEMAPGLVRAWYLLIPDEELRTVMSDVKVDQLPPVGADHAASIELLMVSDEGPQLDFDDTHLIGRWRLGGRAESCLVIARRIAWTDDLKAWANEARTQAITAATVAGIAPNTDHRYYIHGHDAQGVRFGLELAPSPL